MSDPFQQIVIAKYESGWSLVVMTKCETVERLDNLDSERLVEEFGKRLKRKWVEGENP